MPVLPEEITSATFRRRWWRGYDRGQVDALLAQVARDYAGAIERIGQEAAQTPEIVERARRDAETETASARNRAERTATAIIAQAEEAGAALTGQAEAIRAQARADTESARADTESARVRLDEAHAQARQLEDNARARWEALRLETERGWERLLAADRRMTERVHQLERALAGLRSRVALLDQVGEVEDLLTTIRSEARPHWNGSESAPTRL